MCILHFTCNEPISGTEIPAWPARCRRSWSNNRIWLHLRFLMSVRTQLPKSSSTLSFALSVSSFPFSLVTMSKQLWLFAIKLLPFLARPICRVQKVYCIATLGLTFFNIFYFLNKHADRTVLFRFLNFAKHGYFSIMCNLLCIFLMV